MREINLEGLRVSLGDPILVGGGVGHHWFPMISQFPTGELIVSVSVSPDAHKLPFNAQGVYRSTDQGNTWELCYNLVEAAAGIRIPRPDGDILALGRVKPSPIGQWRTLAGNYVRYQQGGQRIVIERSGLHVIGLPRNIQPYTEDRVYPGTENRGIQMFDGDGFEFDGRLLATMYGTFEGDSRYSSWVLTSEDEGHTWEYLATIAGPDAVPDAREGPCEPSMTALETGELMCVMRVAGGRGNNLVRSYSADGGRTWSPVDRLPAFSVEPCLRRLHNGTLALSSGRPGIYLWLSTDPRGEAWQEIDIVAHHNAAVVDPQYTITPERSGSREKRHLSDQTTAYTDMVEIGPGQLLLVYDRSPFGWRPVPEDSHERNRIYVLPIAVERV